MGSQAIRNINPRVPQESRLPPNNSSLEEALIGAILSDSEAMEQVSSILRTPDIFYVHANRKLYEAFSDLFEKRLPTDVISVGDWLKSDGSLDAVGGFSRLKELLRKSQGSLNVIHYANRLHEYYLARKAIKVFGESIDLMHDQSLPVIETLGKIEQRVFDINEYSKAREMCSTGDILPKVFTEINEIQARGGVAISGVATGFSDLDMMSQGYRSSDLILLGARPSQGKTSLALQSAYYVAKTTQQPVCFFSLEMSKEALVKRLLSLESSIDARRIDTGRINSREMNALFAAVSNLAEVPLYIDDSPGLTLNEMASKIRRLQIHTQKKVALACLDYIQLMPEADEGPNRHIGLSRISRGLKAIAREQKVPFMALVQIKREVETRADKRPVMSDLKECGSFEQDADLIGMIYRHEFYFPQSIAHKGLAELNIVKQREGPTGRVNLYFEGQFTRFKDHDGAPLPPD